MRSFKSSVRGNVPAGGRRQARPCSGVAILDLRCLVAVSLLALGGCAAPARVPVPPAPVEIPESTWWRVDNDIGAGMLAATGPARDYARGEMERWMSGKASVAEMPALRGELRERLPAAIGWYYDYRSGQDRPVTTSQGEKIMGSKDKRKEPKGKKPKPRPIPAL